jgi:hypothetical protein
MLLMRGAVGLRERVVRRQEIHCEGYCETMLSAPLTARPPVPDDGHTYEEQAAEDGEATRLGNACSATGCCASRGLDRSHHL